VALTVLEHGDLGGVVVADDEVVVRIAVEYLEGAVASGERAAAEIAAV
jgi:hypothetical protein